MLQKTLGHIEEGLKSGFAPCCIAQFLVRLKYRDLMLKVYPRMDYHVSPFLITNFVDPKNKLKINHVLCLPHLLYYKMKGKPIVYNTCTYCMKYALENKTCKYCNKEIVWQDQRKAL